MAQSGSKISLSKRNNANILI